MMGMKAQATVISLQNLVSSIDRPDVPLITGIMDQFNKSAEKRIDDIFWRMMQLIFVMGGIGLILLTVHFKLKRKISG